MSQFMIIPEGRDSESFLELARTPKTKGRLFRKHILSTGTLHHGGRKIEIDDTFLNTIVKNFRDKVCDIVQVPIVDDANRHSEDPSRNIGEVIDLQVENGKLYSYIDSRKSGASDELGNTLIGASAMLSTNYVDTSTNTPKGPTLLHVAITNRPHVLNLDDFEEIIAASSNPSDEVILLSETSESSDSEETKTEETQNMTKEELIDQLKAEHDIDVAVLLSNEERIAELEAEKTELSAASEALTAEVETLKAEAASSEELAVKLSNSIKESLQSDVLLQLSNDDSVSTQVETLIAAVTDAGTQMTEQKTEIVNLSGRIDTLEADKQQTIAASHVDELISAGRLLPVNRDAMIELRLSNEELFDKIVPETPVIQLSKEDGTGENPADDKDFVQTEVTRLLQDNK